jgi:DNA-nicking Smr family endonuclease
MAAKEKKRSAKLVKTVASNRLDSSNPTLKKPIVLGYDPAANFKDILEGWERTGELDGVTKRMKSHSKLEVTKSFGEILAEWEGEKQKAKKAKEEGPPPPKSKPYVPTKDFGALLDEFEGARPKKQPQQRQKSKKKHESGLAPMRASDDMQRALEEKDELDSERSSEATWSFADTYRQWSKQADEVGAIEASKEHERRTSVATLTVTELRAMLPEATIDLHGMTVAEAEVATAHFLQEAVQHNLNKVAIITGTGLHNEKGYSLLKEAALEQIRSSGIVREAYTPKARYGGSGVIWVIVKQQG